MRTPSEALLYTGTRPDRAHDADAGYDLASAVHASIPPGEVMTVSLGLSMVVPDGHAGMVVSRSGLASKHVVTILNSPGIIDAGYRGDVKAILMNHGSETFHIAPGDRIAQLLLVPVTHPRWERVDVLPAGDRGGNGFGSTGVR